MLAFENTVTIRKPLSEVFRFVSDQRNNPKWNYYVSSVERTNDLLGSGAEYLQVRQGDMQRFRVVELVQDQRCVIETLPGERPAVRRCICFAGGDEQTTIRDRVELRLPLPGFLSSLLTARPKRAVRHNLQCLKSLLEHGEVVLLDGRIARTDD